MGGNSRAINHHTGDVMGYAEKVDLRIFDRRRVRQDIFSLLLELDKRFEESADYPSSLWDNTSVFGGVQFFNGSTASFFDNKISDGEYVKHKPLLGDIDVTVPAEKLESLFGILQELEGEDIWRFKYLGQPKKKFYGHQINGVFRYNDEINLQIDFEGVEYKNNGFPSEFARFSHCSSWDDTVNGLKGVNHKFLLINMVRAVSMREDILVLTPKSPLEEENHRPMTKYQRETPRTLAFSVDRGLREKLEKQYIDGEEVIINGQEVYKTKPTSDSEYVTDLHQIYEMLFGCKPEYPKKVEKMWSFTGLTKLMEEYFTKQQVEDTFKFLYKINLFNEHAQELDRDDPTEDHRVKWNMIDHLIDHFTYLEKYKFEIKKLSEEYYKTYGTRRS